MILNIRYLFVVLTMTTSFCRLLYNKTPNENCEGFGSIPMYAIFTHYNKNSNSVVRFKRVAARSHIV